MSFKNTREAAQAINGMKRASHYLHQPTKTDPEQSSAPWTSSETSRYDLQIDLAVWLVITSLQEHKEAVPMRRYAGGTGRCAQGEFNHPLGQNLRWAEGFSTGGQKNCALRIGSNILHRQTDGCLPSPLAS